MVGAIAISLFVLLFLPTNLDAQTDNSLYQNYTNPDFNVSIEYPINWTAQEVNLNPNEVVGFYPDEFGREFELPVGLAVTIYHYNYSFTNFDEYFSFVTQYYNAIEGIRIVNESQTTLAERPVYNITYYDYTGHNHKRVTVSTYIGNEDIVLSYYAEPGYFNKYLPGANKIINSFQLTNTTN
jgi:hypothetical protein